MVIVLQFLNAFFSTFFSPWIGKLKSADGFPFFQKDLFFPLD